MSFSFIDKTNIVGAFQESEDYMKAIFEPYDEYERLARNRPHPSIADHLPKVTEGTLSSTIHKQPRRVIQQMPSGKIKFSDDDGLTPVLQVFLDTTLIPNAITGGTMLQKGWESTTKALTYGSQPILSFFTQHGTYFGADCRLPYIRDVFHEKGQLCSGDSKVEFVRSWYTKAQLKSIIKTEEYLIKQSKERGDPEPYVSTWDLTKLSQLLNLDATPKKQESQTPGERATGGDAGGYEIITGLQEGIGAEFYSFAPALAKENETDGSNIVRVKVNPDSRGVMPIKFQFHTVDGGAPNGRGAVEHSGPVQNLIDSQLQMFQYNMSLIQAPPIKVWGDLPNKTYRMAPDAIWRMGDKSKGNDAEPVTVSTQGIQNFNDNFSLLKSILITGLNGQDTSISASVGNPGFSKTNAGVKQQQSILGVDDNYIRKQYETAWGQVMEDMLNITISENLGRKEMIVEGDQLEKLLPIYPELEQNGGRLDIIFDRIQGSATLEIDAGTSAGDDDSEQAEIIAGIIASYTENEVVQARLAEENYEFSLGEAYSRQIVKSGVQDPEKIIRKLSKEEIEAKAQEAAANAAAAGIDPATGQPIANPNIVPEETMPTDANLGPEEDDGLNGLRDLGLDEDQITNALDMFRSGASADDVMESLGIPIENRVEEEVLA